MVNACEPTISFEEIELHGVSSDSPIVEGYQPECFDLRTALVAGIITSSLFGGGVILSGCDPEPGVARATAVKVQTDENNAVIEALGTQVPLSADLGGPDARPLYQANP